MDRRLFIAGCILLFGGISSLVLLSISPSEALGQFGFVGLGLLTYVLVQFLPVRLIKVSISALYLLIVGLLLMTLWLGHTAKGAQRWFSIGPVRIQVSELAKPILALTLSAYVIHYPFRTQKRIAIYSILCLPVIVPVLLQPDLGSSLVLCVIAIGIAVVSLEHYGQMLPWAFLALVLTFFVWRFGLYDYQRERIFAFLGDSTAAASYNAEQAIITVGSGKLWGRGVGHGVQSSLRFLPEHHTDFFFASFAEETGFIGVMLLLGLYAVFFATLLYGFEQLNAFEQVFRFGLFSGVFFQMIVHIAMNIGLSPVTGIPLPFLSSGGSSFVSLALFVGLALRLHSQVTDATYQHRGDQVLR